MRVFGLLELLGLCGLLGLVGIKVISAYLLVLLALLMAVFVQGHSDCYGYNVVKAIRNRIAVRL
jgi:hypothetical protein